MKRLARRFQGLPLAARIGLCAIVVLAVVGSTLLGVDRGGKSTSARSGSTASGSTGSGSTGSGSAASGGAGVAPNSNAAPGSGPGSVAAAGRPNFLAPPKRPPTAQSGPAGQHALRARCADGTTSAAPDPSRLCFGHRGVRFFLSK
jgi:hypothetical protein